MPIRRDAKGRFAPNGGRKSSKSGGGAKVALAKRGVDHVLARTKKETKPSKAAQRAAALKKAQTKMVAAANKR